MKKVSIFDKNLKTRKEVASSAFYFLFSELVQLCTRQNNDLEKQLEELGYPLGSRFLELISIREKGLKKEITIVNILMLIKNNLWPLLFNKNNCVVEQHMDQENIYMIKEVEPNMCNLYACLSRGQYHSNCGAFIAGIVRGFLDAARFPAQVTAVFDDGQELRPDEVPEEKKTVYLIKFDEEVMVRENKNKKN